MCGAVPISVFTFPAVSAVTMAGAERMPTRMAPDWNPRQQADRVTGETPVLPELLINIDHPSMPGLGSEPELRKGASGLKR
jgi:hypothetical protein